MEILFKSKHLQFLTTCYTGKCMHKYFAKYSPVIPYPCLGEPPFSALTKINVVIIKCIPHNDKPILTKCSTPQYINKIQ